MKKSKFLVIAVPACMDQMHLILMENPLTEWDAPMRIDKKIICCI